MPKSNTTALTDLIDVMKKLRDPVNGCEWDRVQTFDSIMPHTLEETYEVFDAITRKDFPDLQSELGDLLYQIVFYAEMADEQGHFNFYDICNAIKEKLIRRHPHIFLSKDKAPAHKQWELRKHQERVEKQQYSVLDDIAQTLPALMRAEKIQKRCASVGFDWNELSPVIDKVYEEIQEVLHEATQPKIDPEKLTEEVGDLLFATVNLSRHLGQKAETTLQKANMKFERRFREVERLLLQQNTTVQDASLAQMEAAWQQVKKSEKLV